MDYNVWIYFLVAAGTIYLIRVLPLTLIRRELTNPFLRSFLYFVPFVTLSVMTFPDMVEATGSALSGWAGFLTGLILSYVSGNLFQVAISSCIVVYLIETFVC